MSLIYKLGMIIDHEFAVLPTDWNIEFQWKKVLTLAKQKSTLNNSQSMSGLLDVLMIQFSSEDQSIHVCIG